MFLPVDLNKKDFLNQSHINHIKNEIFVIETNTFYIKRTLFLE